MWSSLFRDLIAAHEEEAELVASFRASSAPASPVVTLTLTETAAELMLLLSCLYPAAHSGDRRNSSALEAASFLPLLGLADKYDCPSIIERCASFAVDNILPRLAAAPAASAAAAAEYLRLPDSSAAPAGGDFDSPAFGVVDWVVRCLELAVRLDLDELIECTASLLGRRFFDWGLQDQGNGELMARVTRVLSPEQFVRLVLRTIPSPSAGAADSAGIAPSSKAAGTAARQGTAAAFRAGGGGAGGGGGGPRIVPVVVAAAGPAAVAMQPPPGGQQAGNQPAGADAAAAAAAAAPAPPQPQPLAGVNWWQPPQLLNQPAHPNALWLLGPGNGGVGGGGPMPFGPGHGVFGGVGLLAHQNQPEPLVGGW